MLMEEVIGMDDKNNKRLWKRPSRRVAIAFQYIGMLIFAGTILLQMFFYFEKATMIFYYGVSASFLGYGILLRRYYDHD